MSAQTTALDHTEGGRELLQSRVALAGLFGFSMGWGFYAFRAISILGSSQPQQVFEPSMWAHFAAGGFLFLMWISCRRGTHSARFVHIIEATGFIGAGISYTAMGLSMNAVERPDFIVLLALTYGLMARAAYVPSTPKRTAVLTCVVAIPALAMTFYTMSHLDVDKWRVLMPDIAGRSGRDIGIVVTSFNLAWWLCTAALCTLTSRVVHGLRKEVRDVRKLGQYTLHTKLGEGGMGVVYRASHAMLRRPTAVKLLPPEKAGASALARFEREVQLTASLTHPNTVTIHDYGKTPEGVFYYAMELLDGATLADVVELSGAQPVSRVVHVTDHVAGALAEAHGVGLIHRDIKPANIMLARAGGALDVPKVLDFGLVKDLASNDPSMSLTQADHLTGTPQYICPEAVRAPDTIDARSDLYSLGAVIYFLVTGKHVFTGNSVVEVCSEHLHAAPIPPSERLGADLPAELEALILECLAKNPEDRPSSAAELRQRLRPLALEHPWTEEDAADWWERFGTQLPQRTRVSLSGGAHEQTFAVDVRSR